MTHCRHGLVRPAPGLPALPRPAPAGGPRAARTRERGREAR